MDAVLEARPGKQPVLKMPTPHMQI